MTQHFDAIVVGAGQSGPSLAVRLAESGLHAIADVMYAKAPYTTISEAVHAHPTVSELIPTTLQSLVPLA